jgi:hypothetical protein
MEPGRVSCAQPAGCALLACSAEGVGSATIGRVALRCHHTWQYRLFHALKIESTLMPPPFERLHSDQSWTL